jgi:hypothetical protein
VNTHETYIAAAAGFAADRTDAGIPLVRDLMGRKGNRFLIYETLGERTLALSQLERRRDPSRGYNPALELFLEPIIHDCLKSGIRIVGNFGAANPRGAAAVIADLATRRGFPTARIAVVEGDDLSGRMSADDLAKRETGGRLLASRPAIIAANAYLGASPIAEALRQGADIVITGRVADAALTLGPLLYSFGWPLDDWQRLAAGTLAGHLLECGSQITGGYFADPGMKDVPRLDAVGYPIAEIDPSGNIVITKPADTGGVVDRRTVTEQLLYEIHDPAAYLTPDVVLDLSEVQLEEIGPNRVRVTGGIGRRRPDTLKATVCIDGGLLAEAEISYAGPNAAARARLAIDIVRARMARRAPDMEIRADAIGLMSILGDTAGSLLAAEPTSLDAEDVRVRFAAQAMDRTPLEMLTNEVEALYCAGPAGGGGVRTRLTPRLASASCLIEREYARPTVSFVGGA